MATVTAAPPRRIARRPATPARRRPAAEPRVGLETVAASWWSALDAADGALAAAGTSLPARELRELRARLSNERASTVALLEDVARTEGVPGRFSDLLVSRSNLRLLLGLPPGVTACVFNLDGVLVGSAALHAAAWAVTFDELIAARREQTRERFVIAPFDTRGDYRRHLHGKPRLDGVRAFLASRGIRLPEGDPRDPPGKETVYGLANRKQQELVRHLDEQGVSAFGGSRRYLERARDAGLRCAVVSASANTDTVLERAGLAHLIAQRVDGETIVAEGLRPRPAPDIPLAACRLLGARPDETAVFETSRAGVDAGRAGGFAFVVGVADDLRADGADLLVTGLAELLDRNLPRRRAA